MLYLKRKLLRFDVTGIKLLSFLAIAGILLISCGTDSIPGPELVLQGEWKQEGLDGTRINKIIPSQNRLVLATEEGVFTGNGGDFNPAGLEDEEVVDLVMLDEQEWIAGINLITPERDTTLFKTTDGGVSWQPHMGNYGDSEGQHTVVNALAVHPNDPEILFARSRANVARSLDGGHTWESVFLDWENIGGARFVTIDSNNPDIIWAGGSNAFSAINLFKSEDGGDSWKRLDDNLFEVVFNATAYNIVVKPGAPSTVLLGAIPGIGTNSGTIRSSDGGESWETVFGKSAVFALVHSARDSRIVYGSGQNAKGTLFFAATPDFGDSWEIIEMQNSPAGIRVNDIAAVEKEGREVLYLGTNKGLFSFTFRE